MYVDLDVIVDWAWAYERSLRLLDMEIRERTMEGSGRKERWEKGRVPVPVRVWGKMTRSKPKVQAPWPWPLSVGALRGREAGLGSESGCPSTRRSSGTRSSAAGQGVTLTSTSPPTPTPAQIPNNETQRPLQIGNAPDRPTLVSYKLSLSKYTSNAGRGSGREYYEKFKFKLNRNWKLKT
jgi:hypothetical protein